MRILITGLFFLVLILFVFPLIFENKSYSQFSKGNNSPVINAEGGNVTINNQYKEEEIILDKIKALEEQINEISNLDIKSTEYLKEQSYKMEEKIEEKEIDNLTLMQKKNFDLGIIKWIECLDSIKLPRQFYVKEIIRLLRIKEQHSRIESEIKSCGDNYQDFKDNDKKCYSGNINKYFIYTKLEQSLSAEMQCDYSSSRIIYNDLLENYPVDKEGIGSFVKENAFHIDKLINSTITDEDYLTNRDEEYDPLNIEAHILKFYGKSFEAIEKYRELESLFETPEKKENLAQLYERIGDLYFHEPDYSRARDEYWHSLELREDLRNKDDSVYNWMAYLILLDKLSEAFLSTNDYALALQYYKNSVRTSNIIIRQNKYNKKILIDYLQMRAYARIGDINFYQGYEDDSPPYYKLAINIAKNYVMDDEIFNLTYSVATKYKELGDKYREKQEKLMALDAYLESVKNFESIIGFSNNNEIKKDIKIKISWDLYFVFLMETKKEFDNLKRAKKILLELSISGKLSNNEKKLLEAIQSELNKSN